LPRNETLDRIAHILKDNEPTADIYVVATIWLGWACGFLTLVCLTLWAAAFENRYGPNPTASEDPGVAKLETIEDSRGVTIAVKRATAAVPRSMYSFFSRAGRSRRPHTKSADSKQPDAIELSTIKVNDGTPTLKEHTTTTAPRSPYVRAGRSIASGQQTPPPLYSLDGPFYSCPEVNRMT
jgi:hypothetical protein